VRREVEALQLSAQDKRMPVTLRMAAELAVWAVQNPADYAALPLLMGFAFPAGSRAALYQLYFLLRAEGLTEEQHAAVLKAAMKVALGMLNRGVWSTTVEKMLDAFAKGSGTNEQRREWLRAGRIPMRAESVEDDLAAFCFWHKSIGEYLCALAFWSDPVGATTSSPLREPFSQREPQVLAFFSEMAGGSRDRRDVVCGMQLLSVVQLRRPPHVGAASNALALMGATSYPMHGTDLRDVVVERCNLTGAALAGADLRGATFRSCTLRGTSLARAQIQGLVLVGDCDFGMPRPPIEPELPISVYMHMAVSRDATRAVVTSKKSVHVIDLALCIVARKLQMSNEPTRLCMTRDDRFCILGHFGGASITVWDTATWAQVRTLTGGHRSAPDSNIFALVATPDGKTLVSSAGDRTIVVWDLATGQPRHKINLRPTLSQSLCLSPPDAPTRIIAGCHDGTIRGFRLADGKHVGTIKAHTDHVLSVYVTRDGAKIFSGSFDHTARCFDAATGAELLRLPHHGRVTTSASRPTRSTS